ncbi:MAG: hypothetical protein RBU37_25870 [Myxococcota bacterium]|jgi:hypothetical protein|nr:hypothetical protein [Myxococcota bacterium]
MAQRPQPQLSLLLRAAACRWLALLKRPRPLLAILATLLLLAGLGSVLLPDVANTASHDDPGGPALEMAFWFACLYCAVASFRIMEALFRTGDARILAPLPIRPAPLFIYRLASSLAEGVLAWIGAAFFFSALLFVGAYALFLAAIWVWFAAIILSTAVGFAVQLYTGSASLRGEQSLSAFGPMGFAVAPGIALAISVTLVLVQKLVAEELLRSGFNAGARFGLGLALLVSVACLLAAQFWFRRDFHRIFARFLETDLFVPDSGYAYFKEGPSPAKGFERLLPQDLLLLVRKDRLQLRRRATLGYLLVWGAALGCLALLAARGADALQFGVLLALPLLSTALFANPWGALWRPELEPGIAASLPVPASRLTKAKKIVSLRESAGLAVPWFLSIAIGVGMDHRGWVWGLLSAFIAVAILLSANGILCRVAARDARLSLLAGLLLSASFAATITLVWHAAITLAIFLAALDLVLPRQASPEPQR